MTTRCPWSGTDPLYIRYHDEEWGVPQHDDRHLFEMLVLEGAQAGLSWLTILKKRARYREVYRRFDPVAVARFGAREKTALLADAGIVRNRLKVEASVANARALLAVAEEHGSFDAYLWRFVDGRPLVNRWRSHGEVPAETPQSFRFVGPTICYAFMQAVGMVNDHLVGCFRHPGRAKAQG
jgi:DNA-3-methyladenine glycosylase I